MRNRNIAPLCQPFPDGKGGLNNVEVFHLVPIGLAPATFLPVACPSRNAIDGVLGIGKNACVAWRRSEQQFQRLSQRVELGALGCVAIIVVQGLRNVAWIAGSEKDADTGARTKTPVSGAYTIGGNDLVILFRHVEFAFAVVFVLCGRFSEKS